MLWCSWQRRGGGIQPVFGLDPAFQSSLSVSRQGRTARLSAVWTNHRLPFSLLVKATDVTSQYPAQFMSSIRCFNPLTPIAEVVLYNTCTIHSYGPTHPEETHCASRTLSVTCPKKNRIQRNAAAVQEEFKESTAQLKDTTCFVPLSSRLYVITRYSSRFLQPMIWCRPQR